MIDDNQQDDIPGVGFLARLDELIRAVGGPTLAAKIAGVSRTTLDQWRAGRSRIPLGGATRLVAAADQSLDWLVSGVAGPASRSMSAVMTTSATPPEGFVSVPMFDVRASAGNGLVSLDHAPREDVLSLRGDWLRQIGLVPGRTEAMFVTGDSMEPTIKDGDMILVDRVIDRIVDGGIYVLVVNGEVRVKRVFVRTNGSLLLQSDNEVWADEVVSADERTQLAIEGRVRWFGRLI